MRAKETVSSSKSLPLPLVSTSIVSSSSAAAAASNPHASSAPSSSSPPSSPSSPFSQQFPPLSSLTNPHTAASGSNRKKAASTSSSGGRSTNPLSRTPNPATSTNTTAIHQNNQNTLDSTAGEKNSLSSSNIGSSIKNKQNYDNNNKSNTTELNDDNRRLNAGNKSQSQQQAGRGGGAGGVGDEASSTKLKEDDSPSSCSSSPLAGDSPTSMGVIGVGRGGSKELDAAVRSNACSAGGFGPFFDNGVSVGSGGGGAHPLGVIGGNKASSSTSSTSHHPLLGSLLSVGVGGGGGGPFALELHHHHLPTNTTTNTSNTFAQQTSVAAQQQQQQQHHAPQSSFGGPFSSLVIGGGGPSSDGAEGGVGNRGKQPTSSSSLSHFPPPPSSSVVGGGAGAGQAPSRSSNSNAVLGGGGGGAPLSQFDADGELLLEMGMGLGIDIALGFGAGGGGNGVGGGEERDEEGFVSEFPHIDSGLEAADRERHSGGGGSREEHNRASTTTREKMTTSNKAIVASPASHRSPTSEDSSANLFSPTGVMLSAGLGDLGFDFGLTLGLGGEADLGGVANPSQGGDHQQPASTAVPVGEGGGGLARVIANGESSSSRELLHHIGVNALGLDLGLGLGGEGGDCVDDMETQQNNNNNNNVQIDNVTATGSRATNNVRNTNVNGRAAGGRVGVAYGRSNAKVTPFQLPPKSETVRRCIEADLVTEQGSVVGADGIALDDLWTETTSSSTAQPNNSSFSSALPSLLRVRFSVELSTSTDANECNISSSRNAIAGGDHARHIGEGAASADLELVLASSPSATNVAQFRNSTAEEGLVREGLPTAASSSHETLPAESTTVAADKDNNTTNSTNTTSTNTTNNTNRCNIVNNNNNNNRVDNTIERFGSHCTMSRDSLARLAGLARAVKAVKEIGIDWSSILDLSDSAASGVKLSKMLEDKSVLHPNIIISAAKRICRSPKRLALISHIPDEKLRSKLKDLVSTRVLKAFTNPSEVPSFSPAEMGMIGTAGGGSGKEVFLNSQIAAIRASLDAELAGDPLIDEDDFVGGISYGAQMLASLAIHDLLPIDATIKVVEQRLRSASSEGDKEGVRSAVAVLGLLAERLSKNDAFLKSVSPLQPLLRREAAADPSLDYESAYITRTLGWNLPGPRLRLIKRFPQAHSKAVISSTYFSVTDDLITGGYEGSIAVWGAPNYTSCPSAKFSLPPSYAPAAMDGFTRGRILAVACVAPAPNAPMIRLYQCPDSDKNATQWKLVETIERDESTVITCLKRINLKTNAFVTAEYDGVKSHNLSCYNMQGKVQRQITGAHTDYTTVLQPSADYSWLLSGSRDTTVKVWDTRNFSTNTPLHTLSGHTDTITGICATPENIVTSALDGKVMLWDVRRLKRPVAERQFAAPVLKVAVCGASRPVVVVSTTQSLTLLSFSNLIVEDVVSNTAYTDLRPNYDGSVLFASGANGCDMYTTDPSV